MISIDQNCHPLWDAVPKLHALTARGYAVTQYVEDIDVAFTAMGAAPHAGALHIERERFYRSGGEDWGAAMFYTEFLGRQAVDVRQWEPSLGMGLDVLSRRLGRTMDSLYDDLSPGDTWQLIGPSYVGDNRHHRTIGDLSAAEVEDYVRQLLGIAKEDMLRRFPQNSSIEATKEWFATQEAHLDQWLGGQAPLLVDVYRHWLNSSHPQAGVKVALASELFAPAPTERTDLLQLFTRDYERMTAIYNQALHQCRLGLRPLNTAEGELPFFGVFVYDGRQVRSPARLDGGNVIIGNYGFPLAADGQMPLTTMKQAGIRALVGKAILLVMQVRLGESGRPLALPYHGSIYMPAAFCLERSLRNHGLLAKPVQPVVRVRFRLLDRLRALDTVIHLPEHLQPYFGREEVPARDLGNEWQAIQAQAAERLAKFADESYHLQWMRQTMPDLARRLDELDTRKRAIATVNEKDPELRQLWKEIKPLQSRQLQALLEQVAQDWQAARIDFYDSRGAIWPWCVAMGGQEFCQYVIREAEIYEERA